MSFIPNIIIASIGLLLIIIPMYIWNNRNMGAYIGYEDILKRKRYKNITTLGLILFLAACVNYATSYLEISDLATFYIVGATLASNKFLFNPYFSTNIVDSIEKQKFCLFLRPFNSDGKHNMSSWFGLNTESTEDNICKELNKQVAQTYVIGNPASFIPSIKSTFNIYATNNEWKTVINKLSNDARIILLKIGNTPGCKWEIKNCVKKNLYYKIIAIIDDSASLSIAKELMGVSTRIVNIHSPHVIFYDIRSQKWKLRNINNKKDIASMLSEYIQSNKDLITEIWDYKEQGKLKNIIFNNSEIPKWEIYITGFLNPFAMVMFNYWPKFWKIIGLLYFFIAMTVPIIFSTEVFSDIKLGLFYGIPMSAFALVPFFFIAPRISRYCYCWGSDKVFKTVNRELCTWLLIFMIIEILISVLQW